MPGQGLQYVGMGESLVRSSAAAAQVFEAADEALGFSLSAICFDGPAETLTLTEYAQPAILTHSIAALRALEEAGAVSFDAAVGHSLGEWTALVATGAIALEDAVRLVRLRGRLMQSAVPPGVGAMSAIQGLEIAQIESLCAAALAGLDDRVLAPASRNGRNSIVVAGHADAVAMVGELARAEGATAVTPLAVSAPFHCALMSPAAGPLAQALAEVRIQAPGATVWSTVTTAPIADAQEIASILVRQLTEPVLWQPAIERMAAAGVTNGLALGPARSLRGMVRRIARGVKVRVVDEARALSV